MRTKLLLSFVVFGLVWAALPDERPRGQYYLHLHRMYQRRPHSNDILFRGCYVDVGTGINSVGRSGECD